MDSKNPSLVMVVDDNEDILFNLQLLLESNKFEVITLNSGKKALNVLKTIPNLPDVIISDIMMPELDGYEFFRIVTNNTLWNQIPFVFLTARSSSEDIRFGKLLGVDDYIVKPFKGKDLIAIINGKINKNMRVNSILKNLNARIEKVKDMVKPSLTPDSEEEIVVFSMIWDDKYGPMLDKYYPKDKDNKYFIENFGFQLFQTSVFIYGQNKLTQPEGILLNIDSIGKDSYIFFHSRPDSEKRMKQEQFMLALIAPKINYFESLRIKQIFNQISEKIKSNKLWDIEEIWKQIIEVLSKSGFNFEDSIK